ncbi:MAG: helix-turn-helix transcriptional regulator [Asgard group archaeon]|nr:helix-turn-helix transcriptional regulator [Asgard group archaeon]
MSTNEEKIEEIQESVDLLMKFMLDPTRVAIWFEITRIPGIIASQLMKAINIKKTAMYYHLDKLEESCIIESEIIKGVKHYKVAKNFFKLYGAGDEYIIGKKKEFRLFSLLIINSLVQREVKRVMNSTEEDIITRPYPIPHIGMWFCSKEKLTRLQKDIQKILTEMTSIDNEEAIGEYDTIIKTPLVYYWGIVDFE